MSQSAQALSAVLKSHKASDVIAFLQTSADEHESGDDVEEVTPKTVVEFQSDVSPIDAANELWKHNILGAPVWDDEQGNYVGFFDMRDILPAVVASIGDVQALQQQSAAETAKQQKRSDDADDERDRVPDEETVKQYNEAMAQELATLVKGAGDGVPTLAYLASRNPVASGCTTDSNLEDVCRMIVERHVHRMPIRGGADGTGRIGHIISQSSLLQFLSSRCPHNHHDEASPDTAWTTETLADSEINYRKDVVSVVDTTPAHEAFELLDSKRLSGIAVVEEDTGKLLGNTSARDIKLAALSKGKIGMDVDILSYLALVRQSTPSKKDRYPSCHVYEHDTVAHVIHLLAKTGYHRVFVVDAPNRIPIGVVSIADVIQFALHQA